MPLKQMTVTQGSCMVPSRGEVWSVDVVSSTMHVRSAGSNNVEPFAVLSNIVQDPRAFIVAICFVPVLTFEEGDSGAVWCALSDCSIVVVDVVSHTSVRLKCKSTEPVHTLLWFEDPGDLHCVCGVSISGTISFWRVSVDMSDVLPLWSQSLVSANGGESGSKAAAIWREQLIVFVGFDEGLVAAVDLLTQSFHVITAVCADNIMSLEMDPSSRCLWCGTHLGRVGVLRFATSEDIQSVVPSRELSVDNQFQASPKWVVTANPVHAAYVHRLLVAGEHIVTGSGDGSACVLTGGRIHPWGRIVQRIDVGGTARTNSKACVRDLVLVGPSSGVVDEETVIVFLTDGSLRRLLVRRAAIRYDRRGGQLQSDEVTPSRSFGYARRHTLLSEGVKAKREHSVNRSSTGSPRRKTLPKEVLMSSRGVLEASSSIGDLREHKAGDPKQWIRGGDKPIEVEAASHSRAVSDHLDGTPRRHVSTSGERVETRTRESTEGANTIFQLMLATAQRLHQIVKEEEECRAKIWREERVYRKDLCEYLRFLLFGKEAILPRMLSAISALEMKERATITAESYEGFMLAQKYLLNRHNRDQKIVQIAELIRLESARRSGIVAGWDSSWSALFSPKGATLMARLLIDVSQAQYSAVEYRREMQDQVDMLSHQLTLSVSKYEEEAAATGDQYATLMRLQDALSFRNKEAVDLHLHVLLTDERAARSQIASSAQECVNVMTCALSRCLAVESARNASIAHCALSELSELRLLNEELTVSAGGTERIKRHETHTHKSNRVESEKYKAECDELRYSHEVLLMQLEDTQKNLSAADLELGNLSNSNRVLKKRVQEHCLLAEEAMETARDQQVAIAQMRKRFQSISDECREVNQTINHNLITMTTSSFSLSDESSQGASLKRLLQDAQVELIEARRKYASDIVTAATDVVDYCGWQKKASIADVPEQSVEAHSVMLTSAYEKIKMAHGLCGHDGSQTMPPALNDRITQTLETISRLCQE